ncbi:hypothetical protein ACLOJK_032877 [Asimina triloba]
MFAVRSAGVAAACQSFPSTVAYGIDGCSRNSAKRESRAKVRRNGPGAGAELISSVSINTPGKFPLLKEQ